jgi:CxxC motif-containing protein (DUF1111 family)
MAQHHVARGWSLGMAGMMFGLAAVSESASAQTSPSATSSSRSSAQQVSDPGVRGGSPGAGGPLPGLSQNELNFFNAAKNVFNEVESVSTGLGPRFNLDSCSGCHAQPSVGGSSPASNPQVQAAIAQGATNALPSFITATGPVREARFVKNPDGTPDGGVHDLFVITGRTDAPGCNIQQPNFAAAVAADNVIFRIPTPTFGLGLVEAVSDSGLEAALAANGQQKQFLGISGSFNRSANDGTITRFGWKAQNKSLLIFAGEAYNVEMGVTNDAFPNERETDPNCQFNALPESTTNLTDPNPSASPASDFSQDIVNFADFMRMLAPPTPASSATAQSAIATPVALSRSKSSSASPGWGQQVFANIGCQACHVQSLTTGKSAMTGQSNVTFQPLSDFALHGMGTGLADGVSQGNAGGAEFRTAPLWGIGQRIFFLHDGRTNDLNAAIEQHASRGSEANAVIQNYNMLKAADQQALLAYLRSL